MNIEIVGLLWLLKSLVTPEDHESSFSYARRCLALGLLTENEAAEICGYFYFCNGRIWDNPRYADAVFALAS